MSSALLPRAPCAQALARLRSRLRAMSNHPELLYDLMGFGSYREMTFTKDGMLIARSRRSPGFDTFIGRINSSVLQRTSRLWLELTFDEKSLVLARLAAQSIDPVRVGIVAISG